MADLPEENFLPPPLENEPMPQHFEEGLVPEHELSQTTGQESPDGKESGDSLYIQQLEFTEEAAKGWVSFFVYRFRVVIMIIVAMFLWGGISLMSMPLESDPEVKIPFGVVSVGLPGASPADVEELIVKQIEPDLANIGGIKRITSTASNSFATISVEFNANEDLDDAIRRLRDTVESTKGGLPDEATDPFVMQVALEDTPVWTVIVTGPYDNFTMREYAEIVQEELESLEGARDVRISGGDLREIRISYDPQKLQTYNMAIDQINGLIRATNLGLPLGSIDISNFKYTVRAEGKFNNVSELRKLPIANVNGQIIRLQDVADVVERAKKKDTFSTFSIEGGKPQNAISLSVVKKVGSSIVELIDDGKAKIEDIKGVKLPLDVSIESTLDYSVDIRENITNLTRNGLATIALVVIMLFLFVGFKEAFVAGLAIPMVFATSFGVMNLLGVTLNFLSLFSLILALGLLVDNAIVVLQASKQYIRSGKFTPEEAVLLVFRDFKYTLITTTLTTVWALLPLLLSTGIVGQFIRSIPITVSATLISSLMVAFLVNHPLAAVMERVRFTRNWFKLIYAVLVIATLTVLWTIFQPGGEIIKIPLLILFGAAVIFLTIYYQTTLKDKLIAEEELQILELADPEMIKEKMRNKYKSQHKKGFGHRFYTGFIKLDAILPIYERLICFLLKRKVVSVFVLFLIFIMFLGSFSLPITGALKPEFLPQNDFEYMYINIQGASGLISERTKEIAEQVTDILLQEKAIQNFSLVVGSGGANVSSFSSTSSGSNSNRAQFSILLFPYVERPFASEQGLARPEKSFEFAARLRELIKSIEGSDITVQEISGGPPSGADFSVRITGDDLTELERLANKYKDILSEIPGTVNESTSIQVTPGEFTFNLDYEQMQLRGLTVAQVASTLRTAINGSEVTKILSDSDDIEVIAEFKQSRIPTINALRNLTLSNGRGQLYQLSDVAKVELGSSLTSIIRIDKKRVVSISSSVEAPRLPAEVEADFRVYAEANPLPSGYELVYGGVNEMTNESIMSIFEAMIVALILIIGTLLVQLNSFRKTFIVLVTIPLATTGVFYGLLLIGMNLSFPVLIGVLALFGIVINNAIILVDKIGSNLKVGIPFKDAVVDGSKSRLEAIFLTSIATIIGMIPLTVSDEIWGGMGASLIFGLSSAMFLTLLVIPILYNLLLEKPSLREEKVRELKQSS